MHDVELALGRSDRIIVLQAGRVVLDAPSRELDSTALAPFYESKQ
jgi:phosphonate transport system ATP-binding protein